MAANRKISGIKLYNLLLKEVSAANKLLPENKKLSLTERRQLVSQKLYPKYKGTAPSKLKKRELRERIAKRFKRLPRKKVCDVLQIDPESYSEGVQYFDIDSFIQDLPKCIYIRVNAGDLFGKTPIFNTREFSYHRTGTADITNRINEWVRAQPKKYRNTSRVPVYFGSIQLRPGHKNEGDEQNYFWEMIVEVKGVAAAKTTKLDIPKRKKPTKKQQEKVRIERGTKKRLSEMEPETSNMKKITKKVEKLIRNYAEIKKNSLFSKKTKANFANEAYSDAFTAIQDHLKNKKINQSQYERLLKRINDAFNKNS
jgi:hypothetical protein